MHEAGGVTYLVKDIFLEITNVCNDNCLFCPYRTMTRKKGFMDYNFYCGVIDQIASDRIGPYVCLCIMGEPLLHKRVFDMVKYATDKGVGTMIFTNLSYLNEDAIEKLYANGLTALALSLHVGEEDSFKRVRNSKLDFDAFYSNAITALRKRFIMDAKTRVEIHNMFAMVDRYNFVNSPEKAEEIYAKWCGIVENFAHEYHRPYQRPLKPDFKKIFGSWIASIPVCDGINVVYKKECYSQIMRSEESVKPTLHGGCGNPFEQIGILQDGSVTYCCLDYDGKLVYGNLKDASLKNIWEGEKGQSIRDDFKNGILSNKFCQHCQGKNI
ncbi:MAG: radical SAM/SPASM domain-containing protein [Dissulfurispiraceae bacterium]